LLVIKERYLSLALHALEQDESLKVVVITLPASKLLTSARYFEKTKDKQSYDAVFNEFLAIA